MAEVRLIVRVRRTTVLPGYSTLWQGQAEDAGPVRSVRPRVDRGPDRRRFARRPAGATRVSGQSEIAVGGQLMSLCGDI